MLLEKYEMLERNKYGKKDWRAKLQCDKCFSFYEERWTNTLNKQKKRKEHLCKVCLDNLMAELSSKRLSLTRSKQSSEERRRIASFAGKKSQVTGKPAKTWFTSERWEMLSEEDKKKQVIRANAASMKRLKSLTLEELADHFRKIMRGGIGFVSKGQQELEDSLKLMGFEGNQQIGSVCVDVCHLERKIVVEFNGDAYHCNPRKWKKDQYSTLIKMTAGEKWNKDRIRYASLREQGYRVIVIWESDWKSSKENCLTLIREIYETN
jgi:very-short-patch-repair endonuclease